MDARVHGEEPVAIGGVSIPAIRVRMGVNGLPAASFALVKSVGAEVCTRRRYKDKSNLA
jgi:hypothetical protein